MPKQKKQNFNNQGNNKGRTIAKDKSNRDQSNFHYNPRAANILLKTQKKIQSTIPNKEGEMKDSKQKQVGSSTGQKKAVVPRADQIQATLASLTDLQRLLNSYEELEMDKNENVKFLVENILQKQTKGE